MNPKIKNILEETFRFENPKVGLEYFAKTILSLGWVIGISFFFMSILNIFSQYHTGFVNAVMNVIQYGSLPIIFIPPIILFYFTRFEITWRRE
jgi:hypothetical protein